MSEDTLTVQRELLEKAVLALTQVRDGIASGLLQSFDDEEQACPEIAQQLWYISVLVRTSYCNSAAGGPASGDFFFGS